MIWAYRKNGDEVEAKLFDQDTIPKGWADSPEAAEKKPRKRQSKALEVVAKAWTGR